MQAAVRRERLAAGRRSRLLRGRPQMMVSGYMTVSSDTRHRALATDELMPSQGQIAFRDVKLPTKKEPSRLFFSL
jgi:hypothetical protein